MQGNSELITELYNALGRMELSLGIINDSILWLDKEGTVVWCNSPFDQLIEWSHMEIIGKNINEVLPIKNQDGTLAWEALAGTKGSLISGIFKFTRKSETLYLEIFSQYISLSSDVTLVVVIRDMTKHHKLQLQLDYTAHHDVLTQLPNRLSMEERLHAEFSMANRHHNKFALLMLDVDHFKWVNDSLGHVAGDMLLKQIAERLRANLRAKDFLARLGGDEFTIIMSNLHNIEDAGSSAKRILTILKPAFELFEQSLPVTMSIGIALYPKDGITISSLIKNADAALYQAKFLGRNNYQYFAEEANSKNFYSERY